MTLPISNSRKFPGDISWPVLILRSVRHGGLAVTQSLGRLGIPVHVVDANRRTPALFSKYCQGKFIWDIDSAPVEDSIAFLAGISQRFGRRAILVPTTDTAAIFVAANAVALREWFLFPNVSLDLVQSLHNKKKMHYLARSIGIPTPNVYFPDTKQDVLNFAQSTSYPVIMKIIRAHLPTNGAPHGKAIVRGKQELLDHYELMQDSRGPNLILQEYISGGDEATWMFNGYFDSNSDCLFGLTGRKIRQNRPYAGITSLGVCLPNPIVSEMTCKFMKAIGYQGILDIGYRFDARDGLYKVFDVNPRIGCTFRLFVTDTGMDVVRTLYCDLTGQPSDAGNALPGRKWIVEDLDLASAVRYWRDGKLSILQWARSFRGLRESTFFAPDDPRAILAMCMNGLGEVLRRPGRKQRRSPHELAPSGLPAREGKTT